jgi:hypothetical protein
MSGPQLSAPREQWDDPWKRWEATAHELPQDRALSKAAIASLVFGIIGGVVFAWLFGVIGLVATRRNGTRRGKGLAWTGLVLGTLWAVALAGFVVWAVQRQPDRDASGQVSGAGVAQVFDLQPGDCLRDPAADGGAVSEAAVVPCTDSHLGQVVASVPLTAGSYDTATVQAEAEKLCQAAVPDALTADAPEDLQLFTLVPDAQAWKSGDTHTASCVVVSPTALTTSVVR